MLHLKKYFRLSVFLLGVLVLFTQCEQEKQDKLGDYLVDYQQIKQFSPVEAQTQLSLASIFYPEITPLISTSLHGVKIYKVKYNTLFKGNNIIASGLICIPDGVGPFPVLSFQNGTNTCYANAPSVNSSDPVSSLVGVLAGNGYIISIADYIGFGESSDILHPYMHRSSSDQAILDLLKATEEFIARSEIQTQHNNKLFLMGYSQGGWATLSLLQTLENSNPLTLEPVIAACGAGSYNLLDMTTNVLSKNRYPNPLYMAYFIYSRTVNDLINGNITDYILPPYSTSIPSLFDGTHCNTELNTQLPDSLRLLLTDNVFSLLNENNTVPEIKEALVNNSLSAWKTNAKIRFFHSRGDKSISFTQSENIYEDFLLKQVPESNIQLKLIESLDHNDAVISWGIDAFSWFNEINNEN